MNPILTITKWSETFENADTRKRQRLGFFHAPSGCDSSGYVELMTCHGSAGILAFGIFQALCQQAATMPAKLRGKFIRTNGSAMTLKQIALLIRVEICHLEQAVEILMAEGIGWLKWESIPEQSATQPAEICHPPTGKGADDLPPVAGFVQGKGKGKGKEREERAHAPDENQTPKPNPTDDWSDEMPAETARDFTALQARINGLHPSWRKRPHFTRAEQEELLANSRIFFDLTDHDWSLLKAYMAAVIDPEWGIKKWQPDQRWQFIRGVTDVANHADVWERECRKRKVPTGLEGGEA